MSIYTRPNFFPRSSRIRLDLLSYKRKTADKRGQYDEYSGYEYCAHVLIFRMQGSFAFVDSSWYTRYLPVQFYLANHALVFFSCTIADQLSNTTGSQKTIWTTGGGGVCVFFGFLFLLLLRIQDELNCFDMCVSLVGWKKFRRLFQLAKLKLAV